MFSGQRKNNMISPQSAVGYGVSPSENLNISDQENFHGAGPLHLLPLKFVYRDAK
jgi:hypothetical protein